MTPQQSLFMYLKLGIVAIVLVGVFVLAGLGKIDATTALGSVVALVTGLTVALGIAGSGASQAAATKAVAGLAPSAPPSIAPPANKAGQAGYSLLPVLGFLAVVGILAVIVLAPRAEHVVVGSAVQDDGTIAFVESPVALGGCAGGVPTAATQAVIDASAALALCVEAVVQHDETETPPAPVTTVLMDEGMTCASQAAALVSAVGQEVNASTTASAIEKAHAAVMAKRAKSAGH